MEIDGITGMIVDAAFKIHTGGAGFAGVGPLRISA
jgi:hypothetical protein